MRTRTRSTRVLLSLIKLSLFPPPRFRSSKPDTERRCTVVDNVHMQRAVGACLHAHTVHASMAFSLLEETSVAPFDQPTVSTSYTNTTTDYVFNCTKK